MRYRFFTAIFLILLTPAVFCLHGCGGGGSEDASPPLEQIYPPRTLDAGGAEAVRRATTVADAAHAAARSTLQEAYTSDITEQDVVDAILAAYAAAGADAEPCYPPIVASGADALLPNGDITNDATHRIATDTQVVLVGLAPRAGGYCTASARTYFLGPPTDDMRAAYEAASEALDLGIASVQTGSAVAEIANAMGDVMVRRGLGAYMTWSPGFGLYTYVHAGPLIAADYRYTLAPIQALALEPGAIIPGRFGVRLMDTVLLTEDGTETLNTTPRTWDWAVIPPPP